MERDKSATGHPSALAAETAPKSAAQDLGAKHSAATTKDDKELATLKNQFEFNKIQGELDLRALKGFDILLIASKSQGTGEVAAALNVLPYFLAYAPDQKITIQYGGGGKDNIKGRDELRRLVGVNYKGWEGKDAPDKFAKSEDPWFWTLGNLHFIPYGQTTTGTRPVLVLAPHGYRNRERNFSAKLPDGSVVVSWMPFGMANFDCGDTKGIAGTPVPSGSKMGDNTFAAAWKGSQDKLYSPDPFINLPPCMPLDPIQQVLEEKARLKAPAPRPLGDIEHLIAGALRWQKDRDKSGLACIYGHGTHTDATEVLGRLLSSLYMQTPPRGKWVIIVVIHHYGKEIDKALKLSRPNHLLDAIKDTGWEWNGSSLPSIENSGVLTCSDHQVKIFHMVGVSKQWMDHLFQKADLPIAEGANTLHQLLAWGRPCLRVTAKEKIETSYLGYATKDIEGLAKLKAARDALDALELASSYLSGRVLTESKKDLAVQTIRNLLFRTGRKPLDDFAKVVQQEITQPQRNPLFLITQWLIAKKLVPEDHGTSGFTVTEAKD